MRALVFSSIFEALILMAFIRLNCTIGPKEKNVDNSDDATALSNDSDTEPQSESDSESEA
jgi:hypothetical protein